jgi:hypothetical protein
VLREESGSSLARFQLDWRDRTVDELRGTLGEDRWRAAYDRGRTASVSRSQVQRDG